MKNYLLILGCSNRKNPVQTKVKPLDLYDGVNYRVLKKFFKKYGNLKNLEILIISAKYGLLKMDDVIGYYDERMTIERAKILHQSIMERLKEFLRDKNFDEVHLNLGKEYLRAIEGFESLFSESVIVYDPRGIGYKMQSMKRWLEKIYERR